MAEPVDPLQGGDFDLVNGPPQALRIDQLSLVKTVDRLGQGVVIRVAGVPDRDVDPGFDQSVGERDRRVLGGFNWSLWWISPVKSSMPSS